MKRAEVAEFFIKAIICWYIVIFLTISLLSIFGILIRPLILFTQTIFLILIANFLSKNRFFRFNFDRWNFLIAFLLILTFIQGFFSSPNTSDSLTYHLPRVVHWIQNQTAYQSIIFNDHDYMPPFGEYQDLVLYQITDSDRLVFLSQWIAYFGSIVVAGLIAKQLGALKKIINFVRLSVAVIPMAVLQASSTQTDLVTGFLLLVSVYYSIKVYKKFIIFDINFFMITCCLGFLTKPSFAIFALIPIGLLFLNLSKRKFPASKYGLLFLNAIVILSIFLIPYLSQNLQLYSSLLGHHLSRVGELIFVNEQISVSVIISNIIRNIMLQIPVPIFSMQIQSLIEFIHKLIGIGINDPRTTWYATSFNVLPVIFPQEDLVSNPLQILVFIVAFWIMIKTWSKNRLITYLFFSITISFIVFCAILKWQPWNSRLHLPAVMLMVIISMVILQKHKSVLKLFLGASYVLAVLLVIFNVSRPLVSYPHLEAVKKYNQDYSLPESIFTKPRIEQYFNSRPYWYTPYLQSSKIIISEKVVDMRVSTLDGFEYPIFVLLKNGGYLPKITTDSRNLFYTAELPDNSNSDQKCVETENNYGYACLAKLK